MAGEIKHEWNGTVLTITSDSGTSSMDLAGAQGDTGPRGPQGPAGIVYDDEGNIVLNLDNYATEEEVHIAIAEAQLAPGSVDTSSFVTKSAFYSTVGSTVNEAMDARFASTLGEYALKSEVPTVPTKVSELENDSKFVTVTYVDEAILGCNLNNYYTKAEVDALIPSSAEEVEY